MKTKTVSSKDFKRSLFNCFPNFCNGMPLRVAFDFLSDNCKDFSGLPWGWDAVEISNGGFFLALNEPYFLSLDNGFSGVVTGRVAGMLATISALNVAQRLFKIEGDEFNDLYFEYIERANKIKEYAMFLPTIEKDSFNLAISN